MEAKILDIGEFVNAKQRARMPIYPENHHVPTYMSYEEHALLERQAEISFKAGEKLALEKQGLAYLEGKQSGIKEVVNWIRDNAPSVHAYAKHSPFNEPIWAISQAEWQVQLKEWGIEQED